MKNKPQPINEVLGVKLHPPTFQRQDVAIAMGMKRGMIVPYRTPYLFHDTFVFLWLCSIPESASAEKWSVDRAEDDPQSAVKEARRWATKLGIGINTPAWHKAWPVFWAIIQKIESARGEPVIPKDTKKEQVAGEL